MDSLFALLFVVAALVVASLGLAWLLGRVIGRK